MAKNENSNFYNYQNIVNAHENYLSKVIWDSKKNILYIKNN